MKKIKELQKRSALNEGRNYGIGFAILKPINTTKTKFETLNAFTACRDYLNDFSYVEYTKKEIGTVYGYNHKLLNIFDNKQTFYLGVNTLNFKGGNPWSKKQEASKILIDNYKNLEKLLNKFEEKLNLKIKSKIIIDEDVLIIKASRYWTKTTALISVYTLIIRCFFNIENFTNETFDEVIKNHEPFIQDDSMMIKNCITFYNNPQIKYDNFNYNYHKINNSSKIHNFGISGYFNLKEIKNQLL